MSDVYGDSHQHSNGTCAQIGWLSDTGMSLSFGGKFEFDHFSKLSIYSYEILITNG